MKRNYSVRNKGQLSYGWLSIVFLILMNQHEPHTHHDMHKDVTKNEPDKSKRGQLC